MAFILRRTVVGSNPDLVIQTLMGPCVCRTLNPVCSWGTLT